MSQKYEMDILRPFLVIFSPTALLFFTKTEVQTVILRYLVCLNLDWIKSNNTIVIFSCLKIHYSRASLPKTVLTLPKETSSHMFKMAPFPLTLTFNRGDTKYHGGLRSRELCQAPIMQALSSHSRVCESELSSWNNCFQSCQGQGSNCGPSDTKASAKSTPPRGTGLTPPEVILSKSPSVLTKHEHDYQKQRRD